MIDFDITQHRLVPKHIKLSEEEKQKLLKDYNINLSKLAFIRSSDPALKNIPDIKYNDVIKIERKSPTAKQTTFYRVVVNG
ncbi:MAG TPA: DNA-directed RNA polymerase subunit H [Candidatus Nanoarchaeia archaeon]|nr:DNA-directed RNA polymerase subunit H [Candidatus Nanoarchaeia archaeon]